MSFEIDPAFRNSGTRARARRERRMLWRVGAVFTVLILAGLVIGLMLRDGSHVAGIVGAGQDETADGFDDFIFVQSEIPAAAETPEPRDPRGSFLNLRRDPMILRLDSGDATGVTKIAGPAGFVPMRAGPDSDDRIAVLRDPLFSGERRLITTLPSSRDDFALFQAQRSQAIAQMQDASPSAAVPAGAGETVRVEDRGSWGEFIAGDDAGTEETGAAVYLQTQIENTTSMAFALRESQRFPLFEDVIVILQTDRALVDVLQTNGFATLEAEAIAQAAVRLLDVPEVLPTGGIVALRLRSDVEGTSLMQMSLYAPDGYLATLAQTGARRFAPAADPWLQDNLLGRSDRLRVTAPPPPKDIRLLDALYSAAIRNGLQTNLVGELIVIMSQRFDLERFVAEGDEVTVLFADKPGPQGQGLGRLLFVGIDGPSGAMPCYVVQVDSASGFGCFDFDATVQGGGGAVAGRLGGGLLIPVDGVRTSSFGPRLHPILNQVRNHNGVDWAAPTGTPVRAVADGVLALIGDGGGYGNVIYIDHPDGMQTRYAHLHTFAEGLRKGTPIAAGQTIGQVGTTGRSTGPHLHFELHVTGRPVDPMIFSGTAGPGRGVGGGAVAALVNQIIQVESAGDARAKNALSTATGLGQFIESTWLRMMRDYRADLAGRMTRAQLLDLRFDPALSREMVTNLARENESFLRARGHDITAGRLYLAHFLGPAGAHTALSANPDATVLEVMGAAVVNANPFLRGKSVADLRDWADRKMMGRGSAVASAPRRIVVPPEVAAYRETVDAILAAL